MEYKQIQELIKTINKSNISELSIEEGDFKITIRQDFSEHVHYAPPAGTVLPAPVLMPQPVTYAPPAPAQGAEKPSAPVHDHAPVPASATTVTIKSPMIGTFYRSPAPDKPIFVNVGEEIKQGQVLCIIEAMKLFNEIESEINGRIVKVLIDDSSPVEYDQPLFLVEPM